MFPPAAEDNFHPPMYSSGSPVCIKVPLFLPEMYAPGKTRKNPLLSGTADVLSLPIRPMLSKHLLHFRMRISDSV